MNRRRFLGSVGAVVSAAFVGRRTLAARESLRVRVFFSDRAAGYDDLGVRIREYLGAALTEARKDVRVTIADRSVSLPSEEGQAALARRWPLLVVRGVVGRSDVDPTDGVNLLVTDGDPRNQPAGFARPHVAAATGARLISRMAPLEETDTVVPYTMRAAATQLLLHECGHALGLAHAHGRVTASDDSLVASPMVGSYIWKSPETRRRYLGVGSVCGDVYPTQVSEQSRRLGLRYSSCAIGALIG